MPSRAGSLADARARSDGAGGGRGYPADRGPILRGAREGFSRWKSDRIGACELRWAAAGVRVAQYYLHGKGALGERRAGQSWRVLAGLGPICRPSCWNGALAAGRIKRPTLIAYASGRKPQSRAFACCSALHAASNTCSGCKAGAAPWVRDAGDACCSDDRPESVSAGGCLSRAAGEETTLRAEVLEWTGRSRSR